MRMCSECGIHGDRLYSNGDETAVVGCPLHPLAKLYDIRTEERPSGQRVRRVIFRGIDRWGNRPPPPRAS